MQKESMDAVITVRLTPDERKKLEKLAALDYVTKAHILRAGLRSLYAQRFPNAPPSKKVKRG